MRGPTGCRYLDDPRQTRYVSNGWNLTGDTFIEDDDGYFWFQARSDDMILSAGYNISGPEVEASLVRHPAVAECAVVGAPDAERGSIVKAFVVLQPGFSPDAALARRAAGPRQERYRALQISARDRVPRRAAENAERQNPAFGPARGGEGGGVIHGGSRGLADRKRRQIFLWWNSGLFKRLELRSTRKIQIARQKCHTTGRQLRKPPS